MALSLSAARLSRLTVGRCGQKALVPRTSACLQRFSSRVCASSGNPEASASVNGVVQLDARLAAAVARTSALRSGSPSRLLFTSSTSVKPLTSPPRQGWCRSPSLWTLWTAACSTSLTPQCHRPSGQRDDPGPCSAHSSRDQGSSAGTQQEPATARGERQSWVARLGDEETVSQQACSVLSFCATSC